MLDDRAVDGLDDRVVDMVLQKVGFFVFWS